MKRKARMIAVPVVAVVLVAAGVLWFRGRSKPAVQNVSTAAAQRGQIVVSVSDSGSVAGNVEVNVQAEVAGTVSQINKDVGDPVKKGDVLAVMTNPDVLDAARQAQTDLTLAQANLDAMVNPKSNASQLDISQAEARVAAAEATRTSRQHDLENLTVKSPVSGTIVSMSYKQGDQASSGQVFATISDLDHLTFVLPVTENGIPYVRVGQTANVVIGPGNESRQGKVIDADKVGYVSNGTRLYDVTISLDGGFTPDVRPGMNGYAIINSMADGGHQVEGKGTVQSGQNFDLRFGVSGTISQLNIRQGSDVVAGQVLAVLTNDQVVVSARQAEVDYQTAVANLEELVHPPVTATDLQIASQRAKVEQAQAAAAARQRDVDNLTVRAPIDGVVTVRNVSVGDRVGSGNAAAALFTVADYSRMQVTINVDELDIAKVSAGQKAAVTFDALPGKTYPAEVLRVAAAGTQQQGVATFPVTLGMANPGEVRSGMTANVEIVISQKDDALLVPLESVVKRGNRSFVRMMVNGQMTQVPVTTGLANDTVIEIVSGLKEGDTVVTSASGSAQQNGFGLRVPGVGGFGGGGNEFRTPAGGGTRPAGTSGNRTRSN